MFKKALKNVTIHNKKNLIFKKISELVVKLRLNLLSCQICLLFIVLLFILLSIGKKIAVDFKRRSLENELQKKGKILSEIFAPWCVKALEMGDDIFILGLLNSLKQQEDVQYNVILDEKGTVIGHTDVYRRGKEYKDDITQRALRANKFIIQLYQKDGKNFYDCGVPLLNLGRKIGILRFGLSNDNLKVNLESFATNMNILMWIMIVILGGGVFFLVNYKVSKPLTKIGEALKLLGGQYLEYKIHINTKNTKDEIGEISKEIERFIKQMKDELKFQEEKIKEGSLIEVRRLEKILNVILENTDKKMMIADVNNSIIVSNINGKDFPSFQKDKILGLHLLDIIKEEGFVSLLNSAFAKKEKIVKGEMELSGKKMVTVLTLSNDGESGPKTIVVFENK